MMKLKFLAIGIIFLLFSSCLPTLCWKNVGNGSSASTTSSCLAQGAPPPPPDGGNRTPYTINQTLSDGAQRDTIAFDGLAFLTGNLGGQSFLPPGKVSDLSGFQYLRDNDPTDMGHNTAFVTIIAFNVLHILNPDQINQLIDRAQIEVELINEYAYNRFPLMGAFRRLLEGNLPQGSIGLDKQAVMNYTAELHQIDGQILYDKAQLLGGILRSLTAEQNHSLEALKALNGVGNWPANLTDPLRDLHLDHDVNVAVMTYASEMYSWYAGSVEADTYFCPEGEGTYFGSFYLKDWPAMSNPNYTISENLTASAGEDFLKVLTSSQAELVTSLVDVQRNDLYEIVQRRSDLATELRGFLTGEPVDNATVLNLAERYGELDGEIVYYYATHFAEVYPTLNSTQSAELAGLVNALGYVPSAGAFLYSSPISMPEIMNTDFLFSGYESGSKTIVWQGYSVSLYATLENQGNFTETFNVTIYANQTIIGEKYNIELASGNSTFISFNWNTTGFTLGNYTISAYAFPVQGVMDTVSGWVIISIVGDITGPTGWPDSKVDIKDISYVAKNFGKLVPPAPPNCDVTGPTPDVPDGKIDIKDISLVAKNFGKYVP